MATLYEIQNDLLNLFDQIEEAEGEITKEQSEQLEIAEGQLESKSIAYYSIIKKEEGTITSIDEEIKRLTAMKKRSNTLITNLKGRLLNAVNLFGDEKKGLIVGLHTFKKRKSTSVTVEDSDLLPEAFIIEKLTKSPDKKAIKEAISSGEEVTGATLTTNYSLSIK